MTALLDDFVVRAALAGVGVALVKHFADRCFR